MKTQIVIAGVGGQGVLFAATILSELAERKGLKVLGSETYGMSQRGGSVTSHVKLGDFQSPLVGEGDADVLIGFEATEAHRSLSFLKSADSAGPALCVVSVPGPGAFPNPKVEGELKGLGVSIHTAMADAKALELGNIRAANIVIMGFASKFKEFPFTYEEVHEAVAAISAPRQREANLKALEAGRDLPDLYAK